MYTARPELGLKRVCVKCAVRFYDLCRTPPQCSACGVEQPPPRARSAPVPRAPAARWKGRAPVAAEPAEAEEAADAMPLLDAADDDDAVDDDADDDTAEDAEAADLDVGEETAR